MLTIQDSLVIFSTNSFVKFPSHFKALQQEKVSTLREISMSSGSNKAVDLTVMKLNKY